MSDFLHQQSDLRLSCTVCIISLFLFIAEYYFFLCIYYKLFIHLPVDEHLSCFSFWLLQVSFNEHLCTSLCGVMFCFSWTSWAYVSFMFSCSRNCQFSKVAIPFYTPNSSVWSPSCSTFLSTLGVAIFFKTIPVSVYWYSIVILICISLMAHGNDRSYI